MNCLHVKNINKGILYSLAKPNTFFFLLFCFKSEIQDENLYRYEFQKNILKNSCRHLT